MKYKVSKSFEIEDEFGDVLASVKYLPFAREYFIKTKGLSEDELSGVIEILKQHNEALKND